MTPSAKERAEKIFSMLGSWGCFGDSKFTPELISKLMGSAAAEIENAYVQGCTDTAWGDLDDTNLAIEKARAEGYRAGLEDAAKRLEAPNHEPSEWEDKGVTQLINRVRSFYARRIRALLPKDKKVNR